MHRGIHPSTRHACRRHSPGHPAPRDLDHESIGPAPIGDYLPKLRLRVRTIPTLVWRDGAWHVEWIVLSYPELIHAAPRRLSSPPTDAGRLA